jgi:hypothetical protein
LQQGQREADRDRGALPGLALDVEGSTTDLGALAHHRHPEVPLGAGRRRVEADAVVGELELDVILDLAHRDPDVGGLCVLERVHHAFPGDVEDEERDGRRKLDVLDVAVEGDAGVAADLVRERLE